VAPELSQKQGGEISPQCIISTLLALIECEFAHVEAFFPLQRHDARLA
jgi:hypothetical protein